MNQKKNKKMQGLPQQPIFKIDNSQIKAETLSLIDRGKRLLNQGETIQEKEEGLQLYLQGLRKLQLWIGRETDPALVQSLTQTYQNSIKSIEQKMQLLEDQKKNLNKPQQIAALGGEKNNSNGKDENSKFKDTLSEAIVTEKPNIKWDDIAGLHKAKEALKEAVILPIKFPQIFEGARKPWKGILLYGPPGTGKTYLAKACATEVESTFFSVSSADLVSKYVGESEKLIKSLFQLAREKQPSIIFIDEIDSLCSNRSDGENEASRRVKTEFLVQMEGVGHQDKGVLVLGATNIPWGLDPAVRRRFEKRIYIPLPDEGARQFMLKHYLKKTPHNINDEQFQQFAKNTEGCSGADISILIRDAVIEPVRKLQQAKKFKKIGDKFMPVNDNESGSDIVEMNYMQLTQNNLFLPDICYQDVLQAVKKTKPSVGQDQLKDYENFTNQFGQDG
ncbi:vacuolar sorting protein, putative [Ichthyophthirius multifiliis]|uniref:Vacuolar sorting protein, putative n=1 Tax=Ichthyophthirius multifiliis TaxID=5932 RepID=G0QTM5_ICHMU|nr:vacuolar sorting protein, putative [Ichthyophthirius multifiliis]EGR31425.1 vacuolar sorting protein, putative [Ichthyophthirius multifiliis]|eukprot:XP_004034911.1 vacuolar sorting protein, putative [Ichthyophthirius multifiliis]